MESVHAGGSQGFQGEVLPIGERWPRDFPLAKAILCLLREPGGCIGRAVWNPKDDKKEERVGLLVL